MKTHTYPIWFIIPIITIRKLPDLKLYGKNPLFMGEAIYGRKEPGFLTVFVQDLDKRDNFIYFVKGSYVITWCPQAQGSLSHAMS